MASIDIADVRVRELALTVDGVSDQAEVGLALKPQGAPVLDGDYTDVSWTDETRTAISVPFGTTFDQVTLGGVGRYYPSIKVSDNGNIDTATGEIPIIITDRTQGT